MGNASQVDLLLLSGFSDLGPFRYLCFCLTCAAYLLIVGLNAALAVLICARRGLHQPMYLLLANLLLNSLLGCAAFYPKLLHDLLRDTRTISRGGCVLQAFCVHVYVSVECNVLTVMAYDRYAAVSRPLTYRRLLSDAALRRALAVCWLLPLAANAALMSVSGTLPLCGARVSRTFCDNRSITHLACTDVSVLGLVELLLAACVVFLPLLLILGCYVKILAVSFTLSRSGKANKALSTCVPHLVTYVSLVISIVFEVAESALHLPHAVRVVMSMEGFLLPPLLNPLIYGLRMPAVREHLTHLLHARARAH